MIVNEDRIKSLKRNVRDYESLTRTIASRKNRLQADGVDPKLDNILGREDKSPGLITIKGRLERNIRADIEDWPVWLEWGRNVPGLGAAKGAGPLILGYYYKFNPVCKDCGGDLKLLKDAEDDEKKTYLCLECGKKSEGMLTHRMAIRDYPKISNWWTMCGRGDPKYKKRRKGCSEQEAKKAGSPRLKQSGFHLADSFIKQTNKYYEFYIQVKDEYRLKQPEWTKMKCSNYAKNNMIKLFLSHWWQVAREIDELPITEPYASTILGHTGVIKPFYWNGNS